MAVGDGRSSARSQLSTARLGEGRARRLDRLGDKLSLCGRRRSKAICAAQIRRGEANLSCASRAQSAGAGRATAGREGRGSACPSQLGARHQARASSKAHDAQPYAAGGASAGVGQAVVGCRGRSKGCGPGRAWRGRSTRRVQPRLLLLVCRVASSAAVDARRGWLMTNLFRLGEEETTTARLSLTPLATANSC